jgi:glycerol-3-phosphate dehydrogenase (NAD(P)+)
MADLGSIAVIGGGSWSTALVKIFAESNVNINWWVRSEDTAKYIRENNRNPNYLSDVPIDTSAVSVSHDINSVVSNADVIILGVPSAFLADSLKPLQDGALSSKIVFSAIKGIVPEHLLIIGDYLSKHHNVELSNIGVITGPCHAEEVALERLSYLTIACMDTVKAEQMADLMNCRFIHTTVSDDIYGTEYAAVIKNIIAIASGICHGIGYGDNFQAVLISNAIQEIKRFVDKVHPISRDINDSAYLGDLLVTAYSQFSRNRTFGNMVGKGYSVRSAQVEMNMIAEGYYAVQCIYELNKEINAHLPICDAVYRILYEQVSPRLEMKLLSDILR